jgi:hypothetical protein
VRIAAPPIWRVCAKVPGSTPTVIAGNIPEAVIEILEVAPSVVILAEPLAILAGIPAVGGYTAPLILETPEIVEK